MPDRKDKCPDTPKGATVDAKGCPSDSDGDGVFDGLDQCADTPKGARWTPRAARSDADGDGVCDGLDQCADTPKGATVDAKGCPSDTDGDGVFDGLDQCADTPKGCTVDAKGCPTTRTATACATGSTSARTPRPACKVDATGCPIELIERETELLDTGMIRLQNINFETGKATLKPESFPTLDVVGDAALASGRSSRSRSAATPTRAARSGEPEAEPGARRVGARLPDRQVPALEPEQYVTKGYGASRPMVPNTNDASMAQNRRVEFTVLNKDVLKKEIERRKQATKPAPADSTQGITVAGAAGHEQGHAEGQVAPIVTKGGCGGDASARSAPGRGRGCARPVSGRGRGGGRRAFRSVRIDALHVRQVRANQLAVHPHAGAVLIDQLPAAIARHPHGARGEHVQQQREPGD